MDNKMGTEKMSRLILTTGVPLMLSLLINSLYNFVDSVFVSRISEDALTAISLSAPVQMFVSALGLGNAVGLNAAILPLFLAYLLSLTGINRKYKSNLVCFCNSRDYCDISCHSSVGKRFETSFYLKEVICENFTLTKKVRLSPLV